MELMPEFWQCPNIQTGLTPNVKIEAQQPQKKQLTAVDTSVADDTQCLDHMVPGTLG